MEDLILLDSSVLIEYFRKRDRETSFFYKRAGASNNFCISVITHFEITSGINFQQEPFWLNIFSDVINVPYNTSLNFTAVKILQQLKRKGLNIEFKDLIIASTIKFGYHLATLNKKHFINIPDLLLITPDSI